MSSLRSELQGLYDRRRELSPVAVVDEARHPNSALHQYFEWDDAKAGEAYRLQQAARLIRSVRIVYREGTESSAAKSIRAYVAPRHPDYPGQYIAIEEALEDPLTAALLARQMRRDWEALKRRWADYEEFWRMVSEDQRSPAA